MLCADVWWDVLLRAWLVAGGCVRVVLVYPPSFYGGHYVRRASNSSHVRSIFCRPQQRIHVVYQTSATKARALPHEPWKYPRTRRCSGSRDWVSVLLISYPPGCPRDWDSPVQVPGPPAWRRLRTLRHSAQRLRRPSTVFLAPAKRPSHSDAAHCRPCWLNPTVPYSVQLHRKSSADGMSAASGMDKERGLRWVPGADPARKARWLASAIALVAKADLPRSELQASSS
jgi:hypothetical protein